MAKRKPVEYSRSVGTRVVTLSRNLNAKPGSFAYDVYVENSEGTQSVRLSRKDLDFIIESYGEMHGREGKVNA